MVLGIYGAGGLGMELENLAETINEKKQRWSEIVFVDDTPEKIGSELLGLPVMSLEQAVEKYGTDNIEFVPAVGEPVLKGVLSERLCNAGCVITNLFHPDERLPSDFVCGKGVVIHKDSALSPGTKFGNNVLIQGKNAFGHGLVFGDNVVISSMTFVGGGVTIGKNTYVGPGSCIRNDLKIGENAIIGMGSVVTKDVPDRAVVYGNPAKIMRYNESGRVFSK